MLTISLTRSSDPATEPVTLLETKKQLEIAAENSDHDAQLTRLIQAAREQVEHDTGYALVTQTWVQLFEDFSSLKLARSPVASVSSVKYYDLSNVQQTLSSAVYSVDLQRAWVRLAVDQSWPDIETRWDCVEVTYVCGVAQSAVPEIYKQAVLLLAAHYFENRDMIDVPATMPAYDALIGRVKRNSYP